MIRIRQELPVYKIVEFDFSMNLKKKASIGVFFIHSCAYLVTLIFSNFADVVRTTTMAMAGNRMLKAMPVEFPGLRGYR